jgi:tetratricopeptide (TPR) repeat protein
MAAIFISHSSRDNECAEQVTTWLAQEGYERVFLDFDKHTGMQAGEHWERRLYEEVERCHAVILVLTPNWLESKWCFVEFAQARALGKIIFPIVFSPFGDKGVAPEIQGVDLKDWNPEGQEHLSRRIREITSEVARGFTWDRSRSPYPGIHSFDREDAAIYFGRDAEIREVIERLEARRVQGGKRLVLVLGASGSGKSSLLKAGVLPQLDRERSRWIVLPPFRPEREPLTNFAKALAERSTDLHAWRKWRDRLVSSVPLALLKEVADDLRLGKARNATVLVAIDQFEEAFTVADREEGGRFLDLLMQATRAGEELPYLFAATVRSDVLDELLRSHQFTLPFEDYVLRPMPLDRLPKIIEGPAAVGALTVEKGLSQRIAEDVKSTEALPLLAFALRELYDRFGQDRRLAIDDYEKLGDPVVQLSPIENAVRRRAEDVLGSCQPSVAEVEAVKQAFIPNLVRIREDGTFVRQPARLSELPVAARPLMDAFVAARLLNTRVEVRGNGIEEILVEVSHEALFKAWPLLHRWLEEEKDFLLGKSQLERALIDYRAAGKSSDALLHGLQLRRAKQWLASRRQSLSKDEVSFIGASARRANQRRWAQSALGAAVVLLIVSIITPRIFAEYAFRTALDCDKYAAEQENNVNVPGVEFGRIDPGLAIPACERAVVAQPGHPRLMHNLGRSLDQAGRYQEAIDWYRKAAALGWAWSKNNLGVMSLYGRGTELDFSRGVSLIRAAAEQGNHQAMLNYTETDFTVLFKDDPLRSTILEKALVGSGLLRIEDLRGKWSETLLAAVEAFKKTAQLPDRGISLRTLDRLGIIDELSTTKAASEN